MDTNDYININADLPSNKSFLVKLVVDEYVITLKGLEQLPTVGMLVDISQILGINGLVQIKNYDVRESIENDLYEITGCVLTRDEDGLCCLCSTTVYECLCDECKKNKGSNGNNFHLN